MIQIEIKKTNTISEITVSGHADYKNSGKDIVCAAVSTAIIVSVNLIEKLGFKVETKVEEGYFHLVKDTDNDTLDVILENLLYTFNDLELQFPKYIKIN